MSGTQLLSLPASETWTIEQFLSQARSRSEAGTQVLRGCSRKVEEAAREMMELLRGSAALPVIRTFDSDETRKNKKGA